VNGTIDERTSVFTPRNVLGSANAVRATSEPVEIAERIVYIGIRSTRLTLVRGKGH
jgi:hypothetical protein